MSYRRKCAKGKDLQLVQKLGKFCNGALGSMPFEPHFAAALLSSLNQHPNLSQNFSQSASLQKVIPSRFVTKSDVLDGAASMKLPLPKYFIDPSECAADFEPREFFHVDEIKGKKDFCCKTLPRCGMTGLFFSREEVVDALDAASGDLGFSSPFWIKEDYEHLRSGYLQLKDGSDAVVVSLTASVCGFEKFQSLLHSSLHPSLRKYVNFKSQLDTKLIDANVPKGMNALTGFISKNPFIHSLPHRGLWISFSQLLHLSNSEILSDSEALSDDTFTLVEVDQLCLYNASQLTVPGRLALKKQKHNSEYLFSPL